MTTIATDGKSMAGDSLTTCGGYISRYASKVFRAPDGRIFGGCGPVVDCLKFQSYMMSGGDQPTLDTDFFGLILNPDGQVDWIDKNFVPVRQIVPCAIGSGCEIALGAMLHGATPAESVAIAIQRDTTSGGEINDEALP